MGCYECGLLVRNKEHGFCLRFKKVIKTQNEGGDCVYFLKIIKEDGEQLTPEQHLLIQQQDFRSKKMQGPIR